MPPPIERAESYGDKISSVLKKLKSALMDVLNGREEIDTLVPILQEWEKIRQELNDKENTGLVINTGRWDLSIFSLAEDVERGVREISLPKDEIRSVLKKLSLALMEILNGREEIDTLVPILQEWEGVCQKINDKENTGLVINTGKWRIYIFPLTGDFERDVGQINFSKLMPEE